MTIKVDGAVAVEEIFGGWPTFHDAEILRIEIDRKGPRLALDLLALAQAGSLILVQFAFDEVDDFNLSGFNHQNVIWSLDLDQAPEDRIRVIFEPIFGAACSFTCTRCEVLHVAPADPRTGSAGQVPPERLPL